MNGIDNSPSGGDRRWDSERLDLAFDILSDGDRRRILTLLATDNPRQMDDLAQSTSSNTGEGPSDGRRLLYHVHLPKLAQAGYVEWDRETGTVRRGPAFDEISGLVDLLSAHDDALPTNWP